MKKSKQFGVEFYSFESKIRQEIAIKIVQASMLWSELPRGAFQTEKAENMANDLLKFIINEIDKENERQNKEVENG